MGAEGEDSQLASESFCVYNLCKELTVTLINLQHFIHRVYFCSSGLAAGVGDEARLSQRSNKEN